MALTEFDSRFGIGMRYRVHGGRRLFGHGSTSVPERQREGQRPADCKLLHRLQYTGSQWS